MLVLTDRKSQIYSIYNNKKETDKLITFETLLLVIHFFS